MPKIFFLLSGENPTLPAAEVTAILEAEGYKYKKLQLLDQTLRLEAELECVNSVSLRAAFTRVAAIELFICDAIEEEVLNEASKIDFNALLKPNESFAVRIFRIKNYADARINTMTLEVKIGKVIYENAKNAKVDLRHPDKIFMGIVTDEKIVFGLKLTEVTSKTFSERRPRKKPFFHPSAMPSKLARCMVNLSHAKTDSLVLDPFCGTGSSLIEATFIGCRVLGVDAQKRMIYGCRRNLNHFNITAEGLVLADARKMPILRVDCVVTDPPYGRSASTLKSTTKDLVLEVLASSFQLLSVGQRVCIALPIKVNQSGKVEHLSKEIANFVKSIGFKTIESHKVYVHRTLTREIMVYEKSTS